MDRYAYTLKPGRTGIAASCSDGLTIGYDSELVNTNALLVSGDQICAIKENGFERNKSAIREMEVT